MRVSVIIPVYNAAQFVAQAVESALAQPETAEVILIEDSSPDDSLAVCHALAEKHDKVRLSHHPGGENRGAGASRNLGMKNAQYEYIAFLDADDYYLPGRFSIAKEVFASDPDCDGVYEALVKFYENEVAEVLWQQSGMSTENLTTVKKVVSPEELFTGLISKGFGYFHLDGLVIKKRLLKKAGMMNEDLKLHQDTDFMYKIAFAGNLRPGRLDQAVAIRRIHCNNRVSEHKSHREKYQNRLKMWKSIYQWFKKNASKTEKKPVLNRLLAHVMNTKHFNTPTTWFTNTEINRRLRLVMIIFKMPELLAEPMYWHRYMPLRIRKYYLYN